MAAVTGDILALLEKWGLWKRITEAPARLDDLERRIAALEGRPTVPSAGTCLRCGGALRVTKEEDDPTFGIMGMKRLTLRCDGCGADTTRQVDPAV